MGFPFQTERLPLSIEKAHTNVGLAAPNFVHLDGLNPPQREAVETLDGPVLILAGAGTGKTKALTARMAHILRTQTAWPSQILAVTFTNKAAREMRGRVAQLLGEQVEGLPWLGTFHSICAKILRQKAELVDLNENYTILDTDDQLRLLKQIVAAERIDEKRWPPRLLASIIDEWKNRALLPSDIPSSEKYKFNGLAEKLYHEYQNRLNTLNCVDFGDLILQVLRIFRENDDVLEHYQRRFKFILVDEYQDTNVAQYLWLRLLAQAHRNICCVGDDDQSIYGWRGADVGNILNFGKNFKDAKIFRLEQNYRSTRHILAAASSLISHNRDRLGKTLWTELKQGEKIRVVGNWDGSQEAEWISDEIERLTATRRSPKKFDLDDCAVLVRASHQMREIEERFLLIGVPYRVVGGLRFYERREIKDAIAYFRLAVSTDDDLAFDRVVNLPKRGIGEKSVQTIHKEARANEVSLVDAATALVGAGKFRGKAQSGLNEFLQNLSVWSSMIADQTMNHVDIARQILDESGLPEMWKNMKTPDAEGRLENLKSLVNAVEDFENLQGFLEHVSLVAENNADDDEQKVSIMTLHAAKGLEFPVVFLPGWEEGIFPSQRTLDELDIVGLEEERRLAHVGITRAMEICSISYAANRLVYGRSVSSIPSRFVDELPPDHLETAGPAGLYGATRRDSSNAGSFDSTDNIFTSGSGAGYGSPGYARMARRINESTVINNSNPRKGLGGDQSVRFESGERVFHQKFGYGEIIGVSDNKLLIEFDHAGQKNIMARFVVGADEV